MVEKIIAGIGLLVCAALLLGMLLGPRRGARIVSALRRPYRWYRQRGAAKREAAKVIDRARRRVKREGNVYRPESFNGRPPSKHDD